MPQEEHEKSKLFHHLEKLSELDPNNPDALDILEEISDFNIPAPPESFEIAANPNLSLEECQEKLTGNLQETFEGQNLIFPAIKSGHITRVQWLIEEVGLDPHKICDSEYTTLTWAIFDRSEEGKAIFEYLAGLGVDINTQSIHSESPLNVSVRDGRYLDALKIIKMGANPLLIGLTPLHQSAAAGKIDHPISKENLEARDYWERTPWLTAMMANQLEAAFALEKAGCDTKVKGRLNTSVLFLCASADALQTSQHLIAKNEKSGSLHELLKFQNDFGDTVLHEATSHDSLKVMELLLKKGAPVDLKNSVEKMPVNNAVSLEALQLLHQYNADLNAVDGCGEWPLKSMAEDGDLDAVKWLIDNGSKVNLSSTGLTALHSALQSDALDVASHLIKAGADVNARDVDGDGVYFYCRSSQAVDLMMQAGANPDLKNQIGEPASISSYVSTEARERLIEHQSQKSPHHSNS